MGKRPRDKVLTQARLERFTDSVVRKLNDFDEGLYSASDAADWLDEYAGIKIREVFPDGTERKI